MLVLRVSAQQAPRVLPDHKAQQAQLVPPVLQDPLVRQARRAQQVYRALLAQVPQALPASRDRKAPQDLQAYWVLLAQLVRLVRWGQLAQQVLV